MNRGNDQESRIKPLAGRPAGPLPVEFSPTEVAAIEEMFGVFGNTHLEVIFRAISLLYTIYQQAPEADAVFVMRGNKRVVIPLK